jgi:hypothetical protein
LLDGFSEGGATHGIKSRVAALLNHLSTAAIRGSNLIVRFLRGCGMKRIFAAGAIILAFAPSVLAQERTGDAALGALSGAVVLGPVGAVAGAVIGYTAGPSIAQSWGLRRSSETRNRGRSARASGNAASNQGASNQGVATPGPVQEGSGSPAKPSTQSARAQHDAIPPVQTLE